MMFPTHSKLESKGYFEKMGFYVPHNRFILK